VGFLRRRYSERSGLRPVAHLEPQFRSLDGATRALVWNLIYRTLTQLQDSEVAISIMETIHASHYRGLLTSSPSAHADLALNRMQQEVLDGDWADVADVLEALHEAMISAPETQQHGRPFMSSGPGVRARAQAFEEGLNQVFEKEQVDHRMRNGSIIDISGALESKAIDDAMKDGGPFTTAQTHLEAGVRALSNRRSPNTMEAVREAINATESAARTVTSAQTLGEAMRELGSRGDLHPALIRGWQALYGWTSDAGGVRHGDRAVTEISPALARWMLVSAAAFISLLEAEHPPIKG
jgi:hypothetical protein